MKKPHIKINMRGPHWVHWECDDGLIKRIGETPQKAYDNFMIAKINKITLDKLSVERIINSYTFN